MRMGLSISIATGLYGISFGALSVGAGLNLWQTMALSALMFTGGSQFAFIGVIAGGGTGAAALGAASLLGVRNAVYGMQMNRMLQPRGWRKAAAAQLTIDESAATASGQLELQEQQRGFWTAGLGCLCCGMFSPCWEPCWAMRWVIRANGDWMVLLWRHSWACCGHA